MLEKIVTPDVSNRITSAEETDIRMTVLMQYIKMVSHFFIPLAFVHHLLFAAAVSVFVGYQKSKFVFLYFVSKLLCFIGYPQFQIVKGMSARQLADTLSGGVFSVAALMFFWWITTGSIYGLAYYMHKFMQRKANERAEKRHIRGGKLVEGSVVLLQQKRDNMKGTIPIGYPEDIKYEVKEDGFYILPDYKTYLRDFYEKSIRLNKILETNGLLFVGAPGSGKGFFMKLIVAQAYGNGDRGIILDAKSDEYFCPFFNPEKDILLNFCDTRGEQYLWNFFDEMRTPMEASAIAESLIPPLANCGDQFWVNAPRDILAGLIIYCYINRKRTYADLWEIITAPSIDIQDALNRTPGAEKGRRYLEDPESKMCGSVLSVLVQQTTCFSLMSKKVSKPFYIDEWVNNGEGFIYLTSSKDLRVTLKGFYTLFIDTVARKVLSQESNLSRRIFMFLDEFATLNRCDSILEMLNQGRSKGMCIFIGIQSISQIKKTYGEDDLSALMAGCSTKLVFRLAENVSSKYFEEFFGEVEEMQPEKSYQVKIGDNDGTGWANREKIRKLVLASQMTNMPNIHALVYQPGFDLCIATYPMIDIPAQPSVPKLMLRANLRFLDTVDIDEDGNLIISVDENGRPIQYIALKKEIEPKIKEIAKLNESTKEADAKNREEELEIDRSIDNNSLYM